MIPKKIIVGYQERKDTYSGKLAYVIYRDETGKLRKEKSWDSWRDKKIESNEFDNVPTSGFVLNKHVGGYKSGWDFRQSYCRIYDPRGFEFEITMSNLLYILEWADCYHGKGLDGEFVYAWQGTDLWLEPCCTDTYAKLKEEQDKLYKNTINDELVPGAEYKLKKSDVINAASGEKESSVIYIGEVNVDICFGKCSKVKKMFIPTSQAKNCSDYDEVFFVFKDIENIASEIKKNAISYADICNLVDRFNASAYSHEFWKKPDKLKRFFAGDVNYYHNSAIEEFTKHFEKCFYVDPNGEFAHVHLPIVTLYDFDPYNRYYYDKQSNIRIKNPVRGYFPFGKITKELFPIKTVTKHARWGDYSTDEQQNMCYNNYMDCHKSRKMGDGFELNDPVYDNLYLRDHHFTWIKKKKTSQDYLSSSNMQEIYCGKKYIGRQIEKMISSDFPGEHSDCWYEMNDGYISDSISRLHFMNHLVNDELEHYAACPMTLPFKKK